MKNMTAAVVGSGPAGLMAAQVLSQGGVSVTVYEALNAPAKKFMRAGVGGLNLTHTEDLEQFLCRYGQARPLLEGALRSFGPKDLRSWAHDLGIPTMVGTSGRVFPQEMNGENLLKAWLKKLETSGVRILTHWRWTGWRESGDLEFTTDEGIQSVHADVVILALGGASWPALGTGGSWANTLSTAGMDLEPFKSSNCGFHVNWTPVFLSKFVGQPVKSLGLRGRIGELMVTKQGIEGGLIYAFSSFLRQDLEKSGEILEPIDLSPDRTLDRLKNDLNHPRGGKSLSTFLQSRTGLSPIKVALLREFAPRAAFDHPSDLGTWIKALPLKLTGIGALASAISCAGGVKFSNLDDSLMIRSRPGTFCAGEMLDWEAPTGGYLLTACFSQGRWAGNAAINWLKGRPH